MGIEYEEERVRETIEKALQAIQHDLIYPMDFLEDESFDAVFSDQVIEHLVDVAQLNLVRESFRLLKPGGQLQINSPCRHYEPARKDKYHINLLTPSELKELVESCGFVNSIMAYNRPQRIPEIPDEVVQHLWQTYHPDLLAQNACILTFKPK